MIHETGTCQAHCNGIVFTFLGEVRLCQDIKSRCRGIMQLVRYYVKNILFRKHIHGASSSICRLRRRWLLRQRFVEASTVENSFDVERARSFGGFDELYLSIDSRRTSLRYSSSLQLQRRARRIPYKVGVYITNASLALAFLFLHLFLVQLSLELGASETTAAVGDCGIHYAWISKRITLTNPIAGRGERKGPFNGHTNA